MLIQDLQYIIYLIYVYLNNLLNIYDNHIYLIIHEYFIQISREKS